ncbi:UNVERIFIED_CONTAM: Purine permease 3 [Sesamum latifolium]|uniref:Probable purine permease n=1 Tax=Sesamum latifolium TaxID=2727402 RepID=A0AAW2UX04_9LAMI
MEAEAGGRSSTWRKLLLLLNCLLLIVGNCGGPLILRLYFIKGGKRIWLSSLLQTAGFPVILIPLTIAYACRRRSASTRLVFMNRRVFLASVIIGVIAGGANYFYSYGLAQLPVSTSSLIVATQLAFTAAFAFLLVRQRFTAYSVNAVVLLTVGAAVLGINSSGDRPAGVTGKEYALGFALTVAGAALGGFMLPLVELTYAKAKQAVTYTLVLEIQMMMCVFATAFCSVGMLINNDFQAIPREAKQYELGETKYYLVLFWTTIIQQCFFLGCIGVVFYASSLLSSIVITVSLPITMLLAVVLYHEKFHPKKGVALFLSLWGFTSYFFGEIKQKRVKINNVDLQGGEQYKWGKVMNSREITLLSAVAVLGAVTSAISVSLFFNFRSPKKRCSENGVEEKKSALQSPFDPAKRKGSHGINKVIVLRQEIKHELQQKYLSWDDYFMAIAFLSAERSKDPNRQVGACLVSEKGIILGIGYNGFPRGCSDDKLPWSKKSKNGDPLETKYPYVCHAEVNAILNTNHASAAGQRLYVTMFPCNECAKIIIQSGVAEVIYYVEKRLENPDAAYVASHKLLSMAGKETSAADGTDPDQIR